MKIIDSINKALAGPAEEPFFSFEFFPPKTEAALENLYLRMDKMTSLQPIFVDITWGAGGCTKDLTMAISQYTQTYFGVDALLHLTCTNMTVDELKVILKAAREAGIQNILALRGDPIKGALQWEPIPNGLPNALELVKLIRAEHGDYFCVAVAGFPDGHPQGKGGFKDDLTMLKAKVDAGADFVMTQFFYDSNIFLEYMQKCKEYGITCPIIPGMMPIQSYTLFKNMTSFCRTKVPEKIWADLAPIASNDEAVKRYGVEFCVEMCRHLKENGVRGFHFYTLNLEASVLSILKQLGMEENVATRRALPWRGSRATLKGMSEDVRPINWANRPKAYIKRTVAWDDFPNGRWGDGRSPAFGELSDSHFFRPVSGSKEQCLAMWGEAPISASEIHEVFARYVERRIPIIPWCESPLHTETEIITSPLAAMNRAGFLTINSQPAVNGERSDHAVFGWGGSGGRVYQRAYVEFFVSPTDMPTVTALVNSNSNLVMYVADSSGSHFDTVSASCAEGAPAGGTKVGGVTALTWGVFPNR